MELTYSRESDVAITADSSFAGLFDILSGVLSS
jgi:hypothetical protein